MVDEVVRHVLDENGFTRKDCLVAGVSGGVDSMVLLYVLHRLGQPFVVAHVNYHKRGAESDADEVLVRKSAELMGLTCYVRSVHYKEGEGNFQDWARRMRYDFFDELVRKTGAKGIAIAHQKDDQVETILMKLLRGAGPLSWTGMDYWDGTSLRPLLDVSREQIEEYAAENDIPYREDASNQESDYARNFLRNEWTPDLNTRLPGWKQNILRLRGWSEQMNEALTQIDHQISQENGGWNFDQFCKLSGDLQQALVRYFIKKNYPGEIVPSHANLEETTKICGLESGHYIKIGANIQLWRDRDRLVFREESEERLTGDVEIPKTQLVESSKQIDYVRFSLSREYPRDYKKKLYCLLEENNWPITVRPWKKGDRFHPLGMEGHQLVSDFLTNRKVPSIRKKEALVVVSFDQKICAVIFPNLYPVPGGIAESARCPDKPVEVLKIEPIL